MRIAWFSPFPPVRTGIADCSAGLVAALRSRGYEVDSYTTGAAHDFPWTHRQRPYDLVVYQFGNSSHHDYMWAYALRYPGLVVLHDTHLHHARAAFLLRERRPEDYRAEFQWSHPGVPDSAAELAIAGFDSRLFHQWGMVRALIETSRLTAVHGHSADADGARVVSIRLGHGELVSAGEKAEARHRVRSSHGIPDDAVLFGVFGGLTPEKRIPQVLAAMRALVPHASSARLLLAGAPASHYDVRAGIAEHGLEDRVMVTGYLPSESELTAHIAACDVSLNLRWPSVGETSGSWLRALAAGVPTVITDLVHTADVPSLNPRTWLKNVDVRDARREARGESRDAGGARRETPEPRPEDSGPRTSLPVTIAIDILDEDHSLRLAMRRLAQDPALREQLGAAGRASWQQEHSPELMADDYERVMRQAAARPAEARASDDAPLHLRDDGDRRLDALLAPFGIEAPL